MSKGPVQVATVERRISTLDSRGVHASGNCRACNPDARHLCVRVEKTSHKYRREIFLSKFCERFQGDMFFSRSRPCRSPSQIFAKSTSLPARRTPARG